MNKLFILPLVLFLLALNAHAINLANSKLAWHAEKITGFHHGELKFKSGSLDVKNNNLVGGQFEVDMGSMTCGDCDKKSGEKLVGHLKSDDFFDVTNHPTAVLKITKVTAWNQLPKKKQEEYLKGLEIANKRATSIVKVENPTHVITADLSMRGQTHPQEIVAHIHDLSPKKMNAVGFMKIDRTKWNIRYGSGKFFENLGDKTIHDHFEVTVVLKDS